MTGQDWNAKQNFVNNWSLEDAASQEEERMGNYERLLQKVGSEEERGKKEEEKNPQRTIRERLPSREELEGNVTKFREVFEKANKDEKPKEPLSILKSFEDLGLSSQLMKGIYGMGFDKPSKIQEKTLPTIFSKDSPNVIAQSQSGTGKTVSFVLSMLNRIDLSINVPQALCITPSRELARQILDVVVQMKEHLVGCSAAIAVRGFEQEQELLEHVIVGTPGTILALMNKGSLNLSQLEIFVIDEADTMLNTQGMQAQTMRIKKALPSDTQCLFFSATFSEEILVFAKTIINNPIIIQNSPEELTVEGIKQFYLDAGTHEERFKIVSDIYGLLTVSQSIIFTRTRATADTLQKRMQADGHTTRILHGGLTPGERDATIDDFRIGRFKVLFATDVLARGIDVPQVSLVINFDLPSTTEGAPDFETYIHRIGRTGRFGRSGIVINLIYNLRSKELLFAFRDFLSCEMVYLTSDILSRFQNL